MIYFNNYFRVGFCCLTSCRVEAHSAIETPTDVNFEKLESHLEVQPWPLSRQAKVSFLFLLVMGFSVSYIHFIAAHNVWLT